MYDNFQIKIYKKLLTIIARMLPILKYPKAFLLIELLFFFFLNYWVTLINKIKEVSSVQFNNTSCTYCIVCLPPKVRIPSVTKYLTPFYYYLPLPYPASLL